MLLSKSCEIQISNQGAYFRSLGYTNTKQGTFLTVPVEHLKKNSNKKLEYSCDDCGGHYTREYQIANKSDVDRCFSCSRKYIGKTMDRTNIDIATKNRTGANHPRWVINKKPFAEYRYKVQRLSELIYEEHMDKINPQNLPRTLCGIDGGYQLDHVISIKSGFDRNLSPENIASIDNLQMLPWEANRAKWF